MDISFYIWFELIILIIVILGLFLALLIDNYELHKIACMMAIVLCICLIPLLSSLYNELKTEKVDISNELLLDDLLEKGIIVVSKNDDGTYNIIEQKIDEEQEIKVIK